MTYKTQNVIHLFFWFVFILTLIPPLVCLKLNVWVSEYRKNYSFLGSIETVPNKKNLFIDLFKKKERKPFNWNLNNWLRVILAFPYGWKLNGFFIITRHSKSIKSSSNFQTYCGSYSCLYTYFECSCRTHRKKKKGFPLCSRYRWVRRSQPQNRAGLVPFFICLVLFRDFGCA